MRTRRARGYWTTAEPGETNIVVLAQRALMEVCLAFSQALDPTVSIVHSLL
jgi:hypothetical protein